MARCKAEDCQFAVKTWSVPKQFTEAFLSSMTINGVLPTRAQEFLLDLNFSTYGDGKGKQAVDILSNQNQKKRKIVKEKIVNAGKKDQDRALGAILQSPPRRLFGQLDAAYPTRGRDSKSAFVTFMVMIDGKPQILSSKIVKRKRKKKKQHEGEGDSEDSESEDELDENGHVIWTDLNANAYEKTCKVESKLYCKQLTLVVME